MPGSALQIIIVLALILLNGIFSMSEMAIVSARRNRLRERAEEGNRGASAALELAAEPNRFLSTVQIGITLIGILSGAVGGATLAEGIADRLEAFPVLRPYSEGIAVALVVTIITFLSLVLGELVPKRLALNNPERLAERLARPLRTLSAVTGPLTSLLGRSTDLVLRLIGARPSTEPAVTTEDVQSMIRQGAQMGVFEPEEQQMVNEIFRLDDRRISAEMTPRPAMVFIDIEDPLEQILETVLHESYARFPVYQDTFDNILGILEAKDLLGRLVSAQPVDLPSLLHEPLYLAETMSVLDALAEFKRARSEMALIVDEYGGLVGAVTLTDILEAIVGDVQPERPGEGPEVVRRPDGSMLIGGMQPLDELKEVLHVPKFPEEGRGYFETLGGFVITFLGRVPEPGDAFEWGGYRFEVVDMDALRVDKVLVSPLPPESGEPV